jgi:hypothetical protein
MKTTNDGGPAFPVIGESNHPDGGRYLFNQGMTLRDYFAGQALAGLMGDQTIKAMPDEFAESAYIAADSMLAAREGKQ